MQIISNFVEIVNVELKNPPQKNLNEPCVIISALQLLPCVFTDTYVGSGETHVLPH